jgi:hypothetical protein
VRLAKDEDVVEQLASQRAGEPFSEGIHVRRADGVRPGFFPPSGALLIAPSIDSQRQSTPTNSS